MVATRIDDGSVKLLAAGDVQAIFKLFNFGAHGTEISSDEGDAIGFLDAEFFSVADSNTAAGVRADGGEDGKFVDELSGERAADFGRAQAGFVGGDLHGADEFRMDFLKLQNGDACSQCSKDVEKRSPGWVEADAVEDEAGVGEEGGGTEKECRGRNVAGHDGFDGVERLWAGDGDGVNGTGKRGAEGPEGEFAVVSRANGLADGSGAFCLQPGEKNACFYLGAGHGRGEVDGVERGAFDDDGRMAVGEGDMRAHFGERLADALHGTAREGIVTNQRKGALLRCEQSGDHAHRGAGVAAIEGMIRGCDEAADAIDFDTAVVELADLGAEGLHAGERGCAIRPRREVGETRGAFSECAKHGVTVTDGLVAGEAQGTEDVAARGG